MAITVTFIGRTCSRPLAGSVAQRDAEGRDDDDNWGPHWLSLPRGLWEVAVETASLRISPLEPPPGTEILEDSKG